MAKVLNWDALECDYIDVRVNGEVKWHLRDDVPMEHMARFLTLQTRLADFAKLQERGDLAKLPQDEQEEIIDEFVSIDADLSTFVAKLIRHSYPAVADEEVTAISFQRRMDLATAFFSQAGDSLNKPQPNAPAKKNSAATRHRR